MNRHCVSGMIGMLAAVLAALAVFVPSAQAKAAATKTVYLLVECGAEDGSEKYTYKYNNYGAVIKKKYGTGSLRYKYKKGRLAEIVDIDPVFDENTTTVYTYDKKDRLTTIVETDNVTKKTKNTASLTYDTKGRIKEIKNTGKNWELIQKYSYNRNGLLSKITDKKTKEVIMEIKYNRNLFISQMSDASYMLNRKYVMYNGLVVSRTDSSKFSGGLKAKTVYYYKYKKFKVLKKYLDLVKEQQQEITETRWPFSY